LKYPYQISKVVNTCLILLQVLVCHTVKVLKYHSNCRLNFESFIRYCRFHVDKGHSLATFRRSDLEEAISFKWTNHIEGRLRYTINEVRKWLLKGVILVMSSLA